MVFRLFKAKMYTHPKTKDFADSRLSMFTKAPSQLPFFLRIETEKRAIIQEDKKGKNQLTDVKRLVFQPLNKLEKNSITLHPRGL